MFFGILLLGILISSYHRSTGTPVLPADITIDQLQHEVLRIIQDKCMSCHSTYVDLPFYAQIPGIKQIIEKDFRDGIRSADLGRDLLEAAEKGRIDEATVAKLEWVVENNTMPPAKFAAVHWGSRLTDDDNKSILDWVAVYRAAYFATGVAAPKRANEPIQPIPDAIPYTRAKAALGEKLFHDTRLSGDNTIACSSCHQIANGMADDKRYSEGIEHRLGVVNAPTVYNAVFNVRQFWDGRAATLQEQAEGPPLNPIEMASQCWTHIIDKLSKDKELTRAMLDIYADGWSKKTITDAIAEYEKMFITPNSRFDLWLKGDDAAITQEELRGYQLFKAYRCVSCHVGKAVGGQSFEYLDLQRDYFADRGDITPADDGYTAFTNNPNDLHRFKVPNLRNIELTAPYLHDGTVTTLDDAVRIMGIYVVGMDIPSSDRDLIVAFLRTLTGMFQGKPVVGHPVSK